MSPLILLVMFLSTALVPHAIAQDQPNDITIMMKGFGYEGPAGASGPPQAPAISILTLKNGQAVRLIFVNTDSTSHQVISSLFAAVDHVSIEILDPSDVVVATIKGKDAGEIQLLPNWKARVSLTPNFRSVEEGGILTFEVSCHRNHGTEFCHYLQGVKGLITIVKDASSQPPVEPPPPPEPPGYY